MQSYTDLATGDTLTASRTKITDNDKTVMSCSSGTAFPTASLQVGMLCFRTDLNQLHQLKSTGPDTWVLIADLTLDYFKQVAFAASGTNTYTATPSPVVTALTTDQLYLIKFTNANTNQTCTLALNALGAQNIKRVGNTALGIGDIGAGMLGLLHWDGAQFILMNPKTTDASTIGVATSGTNTYTATLDPVPTGYVTNRLYFIRFANANTAADPTINLNSLGAKTIKRLGAQQVLSGEIYAGMLGILHYDGTDMILLNPPVSAERTQTLTDGTTINCDAGLGRIWKVTLSGALTRTFANPTNLRDGSYVLHVIQDATGGRSISTWGSNFKWSFGTAPDFTGLGANERCIISFTVENGVLYGGHMKRMI